MSAAALTVPPLTRQDHAAGEVRRATSHQCLPPVTPRVAERISEMRKSRGVDPEEIVDRCRKYIITAGGNRQWDDTRESWLARAAWRLGITPARATTLFYRKVKIIPAHEYETLKGRVEELEMAMERREEALRGVDEQAAALAGRRGRSAQHMGDEEAPAAAGSDGEA